MHCGRYSERGSEDDWEGFITVVGVDWLVDVSEIFRVLEYGRHAIEEDVVGHSCTKELVWMVVDRVKKHAVQTVINSKEMGQRMK